MSQNIVQSLTLESFPPRRPDPLRPASRHKLVVLRVELFRVDLPVRRVLTQGYIEAVRYPRGGDGIRVCILIVRVIVVGLSDVLAVVHLHEISL